MNPEQLSEIQETLKERVPAVEWKILLFEHVGGPVVAGRIVFGKGKQSLQHVVVEMPIEEWALSGQVRLKTIYDHYFSIQDLICESLSATIQDVLAEREQP